MRQGWLCATALIAMVLGACSSSGGSPVPSQQPASPTSSQQPLSVTIGIVYVGGPASGYTGRLVPGIVYLRGSGIDLSRQVAEGQAATFRVEPGDYTATARSGDAQCAETKVAASARAVGAGSPWLVRCQVK